MKNFLKIMTLSMIGLFCVQMIFAGKKPNQGPSAKEEVTAYEKQQNTSGAQLISISFTNSCTLCPLFNFGVQLAAQADKDQVITPISTGDTASVNFNGATAFAYGQIITDSAGTETLSTLLTEDVQTYTTFAITATDTPSTGDAVGTAVIVNGITYMVSFSILGSA